MLICRLCDKKHLLCKVLSSQSSIPFENKMLTGPNSSTSFRMIRRDIKPKEMKTKGKIIVVGGLIATTVMTMLMIMAPLMGMPKMPIGNMLAGFMGIPVALGWTAHFMIGIVLAAIYVKMLRSKLPGSSLVNGLLFGLVPFLMAQLLVMPMMGAGFFSANTPAPMMMVMGSLFGHIVYGSVLGAVTGKFEAKTQNAAFA